jgi:hypothetical protein
MSEVIPGATPNPTPTPATGNPNPPVVTPPQLQGATPDTAAQIRQLESDLANANARITALNGECKNYRLIADFVKAIGATPETAKTQLEAVSAEIAKWRELGESPDKVKTTLETGQAAIADGAKAKRINALRDSGFDPEKVNALAGADTWEIISKDETKDGKTTTAHFIKDGDKDKPIGEVLGERFPTLVDSLKLAPQGPQVTRYGSGAPMNGGKTLTLAEQIRAEEQAERERKSGGSYGGTPSQNNQGAPPAVQGLDAIKTNMGVVRQS